MIAIIEELVTGMLLFLTGKSLALRSFQQSKVKVLQWAQRVVNDLNEDRIPTDDYLHNILARYEHLTAKRPELIYPATATGISWLTGAIWEPEGMTFRQAQDAANAWLQAVVSTFTEEDAREIVKEQGV